MNVAVINRPKEGIYHTPDEESEKLHCVQSISRSDERWVSAFSGLPDALFRDEEIALLLVLLM